MTAGMQEAFTALQMRERELMREIATRHNELAQIRAAISGMRFLVSGAQPRGTYEVIADYAESLGPGAAIMVSDALRYAEAHGWASKASNRRQTMAGAIAQLARQGKCFKSVGHGSYRTFTEDEKERVNDNPPA
jgi:hypothetical protein